MKKTKLVLVIVLVLSNMVCFADTGFDDDVQDVPDDALPINRWVYVVLIIAIYYGYKSVKRDAKTVSSKEA